MLHWEGSELERSEYHDSQSRKGRRSDGHVAVVAQVRRGAGRYPTAYAHAVKTAGGSPRVYSTLAFADDERVPDGSWCATELDPHDESPLEGAVALLIPGGGDIDPLWYGLPRHPGTRGVNHRRDRFELTLLEGALDRDLPILAICHGMQLLNVHLGGTLVQHLADDPRCLNHDRDKPRAEPSHDLRIRPGTKLAEIMGGLSLPVNSHHHQGLGDVASPLEQTAWAEDGVLEAVESNLHSWVLGVQWHPEAMAPVDHKQRRLFEAFVDASERYGETRRSAVA